MGNVANLFSSTNYATTEPDKIIAGDRIAWKRTDIHTDYANSAYTLKYSARLEGTGTTEIEITASASGTDYLIEVASATTAAYAVGRYQWQAYITRTSDSERLTLESGEWEIIANRDAATTDPISHLRKRLNSLETAIETLSAKTASTYSIAGRSMSYVDLPELISTRDRTLAEIKTRERKRFGVRA